MHAVASRQDLVELIEFELQRVEGARREQGWTPWLLWAALGALAWQLLGHAGGVRSWTTVALYWAVLSLTADFIRSLVHALRRSTGTDIPKREPRFFQSAQLLSACRPFLIFTAAKTVLAAALVYQLAQFGGAARYLWAGFYGAGCIGWILTIGATFGNVPVPVCRTKGSWSSRILLLVSWSAQLAALGVMFRVLQPEIASYFAVEEARFAALVLGLAEVTGWLLGFGASDPIRGQLVQLRRSLGFGEINEAETKRLLDIVLYGAEQSGELRSRAQACLAALEETEQRQAAAESALTAMAAELPVAPSPLKVSEIHRHVAALSQMAREAFATAEDSHFAFELRAFIFSLQTAGLAPEFDALREELKRQVKATADRDAALGRELARSEKSAEEFSDALRRLRSGTIAI